MHWGISLLPPDPLSGHLTGPFDLMGPNLNSSLFPSPEEPRGFEGASQLGLAEGH